MLTFTMKSKGVNLRVWGQFKRRSGKELHVVVAAWAEEEDSRSMLCLRACGMDAPFLSDTRGCAGN